MRMNKAEREKYGISIYRMSELSGLSVDWVRELEETQLSLLGKGVPMDRLAEQKDCIRMFEVVDSVKAEHDKTVEATVGALISKGFDISIIQETAGAFVEISLPHSTQSFNVTVTARGKSNLLALHAASRMVDAFHSQLSPLLALDFKPNMDAATAKEFQLA